MQHNDAVTARYALAAGALLMVLFGFASCGARGRGIAAAQDVHPDEGRRAALHLADAVSRVCAHESSFASAADCLLVWQATRRHGETSQERLDWLMRHSPCALRGVRCGTGRHQGDPGHWAAFLPSSGEAEPSGWPETLDWADFAPRWTRMRSMVRRLMRGDVPPGGWPCHEDPDTWGGRHVDAEHIEANAEHLRALDCRDPATGVPTRNEGFRWR